MYHQFLMKNGLELKCAVYVRYMSPVFNLFHQMCTMIGYHDTALKCCDHASISLIQFYTISETAKGPIGELELEFELIQSHMTQKPMLRGEVRACRITQLTSTAKKQQVVL